MTSRYLSIFVAVLSGLCFTTTAVARGVTPYLPLNLSPDLERQIERVLILGDKPVKRRPIPAAIVLDALPAACAVDELLCRRVTSFLRSYIGDAGITHLQASGILTSGDSEQVLPNQHGMSVDSAWEVSASAFYQVNDYIMINLGGVAYDGNAIATGSFISLGWSFAQLDIGYRDHWLSPLSDSSSLISTEAPTMPSMTLSNYEPFTRLGLSYEVFLAQMSKQENIAYYDSTTSGYPKLAGLQLTMEPVSGYALGLNRVFQYGGGARNSGASFFDAIFKNSNTSDGPEGEEFGNQVASITSSIVFPGTVPFAVRLEYAGEDNAYDRYRLGATNMSVGIDFPKLWSRYDLSFEVSEWQQAWYIHHIYPEGLRNEGVVIGHWFGESMEFPDTVFGDSQSIALGMQLSSGYLRARYRTLANADYSPVPYDRSHDFSLSYTTSVRGHRVGAEVNVGNDVFGDSYSRLGMTLSLVADRDTRVSSRVEDDEDLEDVTEFFVDSGVNYSSVFERIAYTLPVEWTDYQTGYHIGVGARRKVSDRNDLGVRVEFDQLNDRSLISLRALDYRFRFSRHIAAGAFFGFSRYDIFSLPAYGFYAGAGVQYTNFINRWDVGVDYRVNDKLTRTKVLASDPEQSVPGGIYVDARGASVYLSYRF